MLSRISFVPHSVFTTGPYHIPKSVSYPFLLKFALLSLFRNIIQSLLMSSSSSSHHLPMLPSIFPSITCSRRHFLRKMWTLELPLLIFTACRKFLSSRSFLLGFYLCILYPFVFRSSQILYYLTITIATFPLSVIFSSPSSSSSSSCICHAVGPLVDPFRSHVPRSLFNVYHDSFCQLDGAVSLPLVIYFEAFCLHVVSSFSCIPVICPKLLLFLTPLQFVHLFCNLSKCILLFFSCISSLLLLFFCRHLL